MTKNILCVKWGDKYTTTHVEKLKQQIEKYCSHDFNFYCLTDKPEKEYDIQLPNHWDSFFNPNTRHMWAYRKCYMFNEDLFPQIKGNDFVFFDLDILIHKPIDSLLKLESGPYIVRGWWNDIDNCKRNFGKIKSTPLNSSVFIWKRGQLKPVYEHINDNAEFVFFTYRTIDNYFNQIWYNVHDEKDSWFKAIPKGYVYSWYKGNVFPHDMETKILRDNHTICLFNNSAQELDEDMYEIEELKYLW